MGSAALDALRARIRALEGGVAVRRRRAPSGVEALDALIAAWCAARDRPQALAELTAGGCAVGPLETVATMAQNPQVAHRGSIVTVEDDVGDAASGEVVRRRQAGLSRPDDHHVDVHVPHNLRCCGRMPSAGYATVVPAGPSTRRRPLALRTCRRTPARTDASVPTSWTLACARVTAV